MTETEGSSYLLIVCVLETVLELSYRRRGLTKQFMVVSFNVEYRYLKVP